jgi:dynein light chain 4
MMQLTGIENNKEENESSKRILFTYPMIKQTDMSEEMRAEVLEMCVNACEKHTSNNESAAKMIKEQLDKRFGPSWHVVVGEGFGFEVSFELKNLMYMFFAGNLAVCAWKCS